MTSDPRGPESTVQEHYKRLVLEDAEDEQTHLARACVASDQGQMLVQVWHKSKGNVAASRNNKALKRVTKWRWGETTFIGMPLTGVKLMPEEKKSFQELHQAAAREQK